MIAELQLIAVSEALDMTSELIWRRFCRRYSTTFFTPYHDVLKMPIPFVLSALIEHDLDDMDKEKLIEFAYRVLDQDPESEEILQAQIKRWQIEEAEKIKKWRDKQAVISTQPVEKVKEINKTFDMGDPDEE
jgi:hypothetical protein